MRTVNKDGPEEITEQYRVLSEFIGSMHRLFDEMFEDAEDDNIKMAVSYMDSMIDQYEEKISKSVIGYLQENVTYN